MCRTRWIFMDIIRRTANVHIVKHFIFHSDENFLFAATKASRRKNSERKIEDRKNEEDRKNKWFVEKWLDGNIDTIYCHWSNTSRVNLFLNLLIVHVFQWFFFSLIHKKNPYINRMTLLGLVKRFRSSVKSISLLWLNCTKEILFVWTKC